MTPETGGSDIRIAKEYSLDVRKINDAKDHCLERKIKLTNGS